MNSGYSFDLFNEYLKITKDLEKDWIKHLFQYYQAERINSKQDFTPRCLAALLSKLTDNGNTFYDCCAGTGSLTIEKWRCNTKAHFFCVEYDDKAIPFLLFNLAIRNISATVIQGDALSEKIIKCYSVEMGKKYSIIKEIQNAAIPKEVDVSISNPPFNIKWNAPIALEASTDNRFNKCELPPKSNANYAFILTCLEKAKNKAGLILPCGVLKSDNCEKEIRKYLINNNLLEAVVIMPDKMFEVTSISTCILILNKQKKNNMVSFIDSRHNYSIEVREQNGQFGSKAHTNRTYTKEYKVLSTAQINRIILAVDNQEDEAEFCITVKNEKIAQMNYDFSPSTYIQFKEIEPSHRPYKDIIEDLNFITRQKNSCKLVINETLAKQFDIDINLFKQDKESAEEIKKNIKVLLGLDIATENHISFTKNKNEICIKTNDKEQLSFLFGGFIKMWKQNIQQLNLFENRYLIELRDAMLPELLSGKLDVSLLEADNE